MMRHEDFDSVLVSRNVRYLLWRKEVPKVQWVRWVMTRLDWEEDKARAFLLGLVKDDQVHEQQLIRLSIELGLMQDGSEIRFADIAGNSPDLLLENLRYLIGDLKHGKKQDMARRLGFSPTTVSRWLRGEFEPRTSALRQIGLYFGLQDSIDLRTIPVFLSLDPVTFLEKRNWLIRRLQDLGPDDLSILFPALYRMLV